MPFAFPDHQDTPENRRAWSQHPACNVVISAVRAKPGSSSARIAASTGFEWKEVRRILWHLWRKDPRRLIVRRRSVSAYYMNRPRKPKSTPAVPAPITDPKKLPICDRTKVVR